MLNELNTLDDQLLEELQIQLEENAYEVQEEIDTILIDLLEKSQRIEPDEDDPPVKVDDAFRQQFIDLADHVGFEFDPTAVESTDEPEPPVRFRELSRLLFRVGQLELELDRLFEAIGVIQALFFVRGYYNDLLETQVGARC